MLRKFFRTIGTLCTLGIFLCLIIWTINVLTPYLPHSSRILFVFSAMILVSPLIFLAKFYLNEHYPGTNVKLTYAFMPIRYHVGAVHQTTSSLVLQGLSTTPVIRALLAGKNYKTNGPVLYSNIVKLTLIAIQEKNCTHVELASYLLNDQNVCKKVIRAITSVKPNISCKLFEKKACWIRRLFIAWVTGCSYKSMPRTYHAIAFNTQK